MVKHLKALGLDSPAQYFAWCRSVGVEPSLEKTPGERSDELELPRRIAEAAHNRARIRHDPRKFLKHACAGEIPPGSVTRPGWTEVAEAISHSKGDSERRESLLDLLLHLDSVSDLVFEAATFRGERLPYIGALVRLHDRRRQWVRDAKAWRPQSHNTRRQFGSLVRHLVARYPVPGFMDMAWLRSEPGSRRFRDWFAHIGSGKNLRTAKTPYRLTRMVAHLFLESPDNFTIEGALMLADIRSLGGGRRLAEALMATRLGGQIERDETKRAFWISVYRFFIDNPMLDLRHAGPIVDFLAFQKFETQEVMVGPGQVERRPPPNPNLSMARRTAESLLRQVEAWHGELRVADANDKRFWKPSGHRGFVAETGPREDPPNRISWRVRELMSGQELIDEGRALRHCVASYADSCQRGSCSIWSLERRRGPDRPEKALTIEIDSRGVMVQARGQSNRWPTEQEKTILDAWMQKAGLRHGPYPYR